MVENARGVYMDYTTTGAVMDGVALLLLIIFAVGGLRKGFVKTFFGVFGTIISLVLAVLLCASVAKFTEDKFGFVTTISNWVRGLLSNIFGEELMNTPLEDVHPEDLTSGIIVKILASIDTSAIDGSTPLRDVLAPVFGFYISAGICAIGLFIIFKIILFIVGEIFRKLHEIPVIGAVDGLLGFIFGLLQGAIIVEIIISLIGIIPIGAVQSLNEEIPGTILTKFLNDINIYSIVVSMFFKVNLEEIINAVNGG